MKIQKKNLKMSKRTKNAVQMIFSPEKPALKKNRKNHKGSLKPLK